MAAADRGSDAGAAPAVSPYQKFAKDVLIVGITTVLVALSGILTLSLITRTLAENSYGLWAQSWVTATLVAGVAGVGLPIALTRFLPAKTDKAEIRDDFYSVVCISFGLILLASMIIAVCAPLIADAFFDGYTNIVRLTALIILVSSCAVVYLSLLRALRSMKAYALFTLMDAYGQVGLIAYMVLHGYGLLSLFYGVAIMKSVILICLVAYAGHRIGWGRPRFTNMREYLRFGIPTIASVVAWWVVSSSDRYVIAGFLGSAWVGIYSAAYNLGNILYMIIGVIQMVMMPTLSGLYDQGKTNEVATHMSYSLKYFLLLAIPFLAGAAVLSEPVLRLFTIPRIASEGHQVVPMVAASILVYGTYAIVGNSMALAKKMGFVGLVWVGVAALNLILNLIMVPWLGIIGSAVSSLAAYSFMLAIIGYYSFKEVKFPVDWRFMLKSVAASAVMAGVVWLMQPQTTLTTIAAVLVGVVVYAAAMLLMRSLTGEEIAFLRRLVVRR